MELITKKDIAALLKCSVSMVEHLRKTQGFPVPIFLGTLVRYRPEDIEAWIASQVEGER